MRIYECEQGSEQWERIRRGKPTASNFSKIVTSANLNLSKSHIKYACKLAAEIRQIESIPFPPTAAMERGIELEPVAVEAYEKISGLKTEKVGFVHPDDTEDWGCSPDRLVYETNGEQNGILEVKCPEIETVALYHLNNELPSEYKLQVQGQLWITGADWCDFFVYHPDLKDQLLIRVEPDQEVFDAFEIVMPTFVKQVRSIANRLKPVIDWEGF